MTRTGGPKRVAARSPPAPATSSYTEHPRFEQATLADRDGWWEPLEVLGTFIARPQGEAPATVQSYSNTNSCSWVW